MTGIAIATSSFAKEKPAILKMIPETYEVVLNTRGRTLTSDELAALAANAVGIIAGTEKYDASVFSQLPNLKVISRVGVGVDGIDFTIAKERNIKVFNTPEGPTQAVAELTIGFMLNLLRKTGIMNNELRRGIWDKKMGNLLNKKNVGIVGMGRIGRCVANLVSAFGAIPAFYDANDEAIPSNFERKSLADLLKWADIVTLHCSTNNRILGDKELRSIKQGAWLVNTARGKLLDENTLFELLKNGYLAGAAFDVFEQEPYKGPLTELPNVITTPHIGSYAMESRVQMETDAIANLLKGLRS
jgi:D-3-phosphoglycerate dehydrogenase